MIKIQHEEENTHAAQKINRSDFGDFLIRAAKTS